VRTRTSTAGERPELSHEEGWIAEDSRIGNRCEAMVGIWPCCCVHCQREFGNAARVVLTAFECNPSIVVGPVT
jgi:hypothetical protein